MFSRVLPFLLITLFACGGSHPSASSKSARSEQVPETEVQKHCETVEKSKPSHWYEAAPFRHAKAVMRADLSRLNRWDIAPDLHELLSLVPESPHRLFMNRGDGFLTGSGLLAAAFFDLTGKEQLYWTNSVLPAIHSNDFLFGLRGERWQDATFDFVRATSTQRESIIVPAEQGEHFAEAFCETKDSATLFNPKSELDMMVRDFSFCASCEVKPLLALLEASRMSTGYLLRAELRFASSKDADTMSKTFIRSQALAQKHFLVAMLGIRPLIKRIKVAVVDKSVQLHVQLKSKEAKALIEMAAYGLRPKSK